METSVTLGQVLAAIPSLGILFFLWKEGIIKFNFPKKGEVESRAATAKSNGPEYADAPPWAQELIAHFNHDTTDQLNSIAGKLDQHNDLEKGNSQKLEEILKYGVPCREAKK